MPPLHAVQNAVDGRLNGLWNAIEDNQSDYLTEHGRHFQGRQTHSVAPAHSNAGGLQTAAGDLLNDHPTDQTTTWNDFLPVMNGLAVEMSLTINVYNGPQGWGFVGVVRIIHNSTTYERAENSGPETWRAYDWRVSV